MIRELPDDQSGLRLQLSNFVGNESLFIFWSREPLARAILEIDMWFIFIILKNFEAQKPSVKQSLFRPYSPIPLSFLAPLALLAMVN